MREDPAKVLEERDALRDEVTLLARQVKLLVKAEHALTRARRDGERQFDRIKCLADFAFDIAGVEEVDEVLGLARRSLLDQFELDEVVVLRIDPSEARVRAVGAPVELDAAAWQCLRGVDRPALGGPGNPVADAVLAALSAVAVRWSPALKSLVWVPIRPRASPTLILAVGWTSRTTANHRDLPGAEHLPFLQLFGGHVTRALDSAHLTTELRRQGAELGRSNQKLQASLAELEAAQNRLVQAQKLEALGRLAGGIAHDFNNLLTVILSHADLVRSTVEELPEARNDVDMILDASRRAAEITKRLLAFGRQREHHDQTVEVNALTIELSRVLGRLIGDDIVLQLDLDPTVGRIKVDPVHLEQIFMNLVVNARDAMPNGGKLTIETRRARHSDQVNGVPGSTANMIALSVRDTGMGMDEATRRQLFEPFFTTKAPGKGTGLGLATVYGLLKQNSGEVIVNSSTGNGSCFTVLLPSAEGVGEPEPAPSPTGPRARVLVAEDEDAIRRMLCRVLRKSGFEVIEARDGAEALDAARRVGKIDLVVTDVVMPNMGGPELVGSLRSLQPDLKAIFMSGHTFDRLDVGQLDTAVEQFLAKPFRPDALTAAVATALAVPGAQPSRE